MRRCTCRTEGHACAAGRVASLVSHKILGVSVGDIEEARKAEADGADYVGTGMIFPAGIKKGYSGGQGRGRIE